MWPKIKKYLSSIGWVAKVLKWIKVPIPQLGVISTAISTIIFVGEKIKDMLIKANQKKADENIKKDDDYSKKIEEERSKSLPEQNNDVIRDQIRKRH